MRDRACCSYLENNKIILFAGVSPVSKKFFCDDTWIFDLTNNKWDSLKIISPLAREQGQICELNSNQIFLYGGWNPNDVKYEILSDNWVYSNISNQWELKEPFHVNYGRSSASMAQLRKNLVLLFGGDTRDFSDTLHSAPQYQWSEDTWIFDGEKYNWIQLNLTIKPEGRYLHRLAKILDGKVLLFGGVDKNKGYNDTWIFQYDGTDVNDNLSSSDFISPNPATDFIEISGINPMVNHGVDGSDVKIFDIFGQIQTTQSLRDTPPYQGGEKVKIDVSGLAPGMYFVRIGDKFGKFVKL